MDLLIKAKADLQNIDEPPLIQYFTKRCRNHVTGLGWDMEDLISFLIESLQQGKYLGSEWCNGSCDRHIAACDSYVYRRKGIWRESTKSYVEEDTYTKFAISKSGALMLLVSCHPSGAI